MKQPAALLSLPLLLSLLLAPPITQHHESSSSIIQSFQQSSSTRDPISNDDTWRDSTTVTDHLRRELKWQQQQRSQKKAHGEESDSEDDETDDETVKVKKAIKTMKRQLAASKVSKAKVEVLDVEDEASQNVILARPITPTLSAPALMMMLDYASRIPHHRGLEQSLHGIATSLERHGFSIDHRFQLPLQALLARPGRLKALATLLQTALYQTRVVSTQSAQPKLITYETVYRGGVADRIQVPDEAVFQIACYAKDRRVVEYLLSTRGPESMNKDIQFEPLAAFREPIPKTDAHQLWRMLQSFPQLQRFGRFEGEAKVAMQVAWFDQTRRDRDIAARESLEMWLFGERVEFESDEDVVRWVQDVELRRREESSLAVAMA